MTLPPTKPSGQPTSAKTPSSQSLKFSKKRLALAFAIAGLSDTIGAFATPFTPARMGGGHCYGAAALHGSGPPMATVAGTSPGGDPGVRCASLLAAGGRGDRCPGHAATEV